MKEVGEFASAVIELAGDGDVSANDLLALNREGSEAIDSIQRSLREAKRVHLAGRPSAQEGGAYAPRG